MPHRDIHVDFNFSFSGLNSNGVDEAELLKLFPLLQQVKSGLHAMKEIGQLPFLSQIYSEDFFEFEKLANEILNGYEDLVVVAPVTVTSAIKMIKRVVPSSSKKSIYFWDSLALEDFSGIFEKINPEKTLFLFITYKNKDFTEWPKFFLVYDFLKKKFAEDEVRKKILFMAAEEDLQCEWIAKHLGIKVYRLPLQTIDTFSFFSPQVLLAAVFLGLNIQEIVQGAQRMDQRCNLSDLWVNPAAMLALVLYFFYQKRNCRELIHLYHLKSQRSQINWFHLLWSQCLGHQFDLSGKNRHYGISHTCFFVEELYCAGAQLLLEGPDNKVVMIWNQQKHEADEYLPDIFPAWKDLNFLSGKSFSQINQAQTIAVEQALSDVGIPSFRLNLFGQDAYVLGQLINLVEISALLLAGLFNLNPYQTQSIEKIRNYLLGLLGEEKSHTYDAKVKRQIKNKKYII